MITLRRQVRGSGHRPRLAAGRDSRPTRRRGAARAAPPGPHCRTRDCWWSRTKPTRPCTCRRLSITAVECQRLTNPETAWTQSACMGGPAQVPGIRAGHGPPVSPRPAHRGPVPGAAAGPGRRPGTHGPALHQPAAPAPYDRGLVPAPPADDRGHLPGRARLLGRGRLSASGWPRPAPAPHPPCRASSVGSP